eukprot:1297236-Prymnesium_polylepis.1
MQLRGVTGYDRTHAFGEHGPSLVMAPSAVCGRFAIKPYRLSRRPHSARGDRTYQLPVPRSSTICGCPIWDFLCVSAQVWRSVQGTGADCSGSTLTHRPG